MNEQEKTFIAQIKNSLSFNNEVTFMYDRVADFVCQRLESMGYKKVTMEKEDLEKEMADISDFAEPVRYYSYDSINHHLYTSGIYKKEIEEARTDVIDVLQIYESLGKELLALPFLTGKNLLSDKEEYLLLSPSGIITAKSSFFVKSQSFYCVSTELNKEIILPLLLNHRDSFGKIYPPRIAPVQVVILPLQANAAGIRKKCMELNDVLNKNGVRTCVYETAYALGELNELKGKGYPMLITFGPKDMELNQVEVYLRNKEDKVIICLDHLTEDIIHLLDSLHTELYNGQVKLQFQILKKSLTFNEALNQKLMWCGKKECLNKINEKKNKVIIRPFNQLFFSQKCCICGEKAVHLIDVLNFKFKLAINLQFPKNNCNKKIDMVI